MVNEFPIILKLGGRAAVFESLSQGGHLRTPKALEMWVRRGRISGSATSTLMALAESRRISYTARDFELPSAEAA